MSGFVQYVSSSVPNSDVVRGTSLQRLQTVKAASYSTVTFAEILACSVSRLCEQQGVQQQVGLLQVLADVSILVQAKYVRAGYDGQAGDVVQVALVIGQVQRLVHPTGAQGVAWLQHGGGVVRLQDGHQRVPVVSICHLQQSEEADRYHAALAGARMNKHFTSQQLSAMTDALTAASNLWMQHQTIVLDAELNLQLH